MSPKPSGGAGAPPDGFGADSVVVFVVLVIPQRDGGDAAGMSERVGLWPLAKGNYDVAFLERLVADGTCRLAGCTHGRSPFFEGLQLHEFSWPVADASADALMLNAP